MKTRTEISKAVLDHYRCPAEFAEVTYSEPSGIAGYFRFGHGATCYGRLAEGQTSASADRRLLESVKPGRSNLPFSPDEVVDNLRHERYVGQQSSGWRQGLKRMVREIYYFFRPVLPVNLRKHLQRASLSRRNGEGFPTWPVDSTVESILQTVTAGSLHNNGIKGFPFIWFWPNGHSACSIMTHDVETEAGRDFCSELMDIDDSFGIKASFQVVPLERYEVSRAFLQDIRNRGFEVNVHDLNHDGHLYRDHKQFRERAARINSYLQEFGTQGFRAAVLYRNLDWYSELACAYDMSVPNVGRLDPQPGGCCTVMPYFVGDILEIPVTATQDYSLFNILGTYSIELWQQQISRIMEQNGLVSFIVHPDYLDSERAKAAYSALLEHLASLRDRAGLWITLPRELNKWWRQRSRMELVRTGDQWRIEGEGSERACLAYATLADGKLTYSLANSSLDTQSGAGAAVGADSANASLEC